MRVRDLMTSDVVSCRGYDSLHHVVQLLKDHDCGILPVVDGGGRVIGMVSDRDVCLAAYAYGSNLQSVPATSAMTSTVHTCTDDEPLPGVLERMAEHQIRRMPVVTPDARIVGMLSLNDVAVAWARGQGDVTCDAVAGTLAAICERRRPSLPWLRARDAVAAQ